MAGLRPLRISTAAATMAAGSPSGAIPARAAASSRFSASRSTDSRRPSSAAGAISSEVKDAAAEEVVLRGEGEQLPARVERDFGDGECDAAPLEQVELRLGLGDERGVDLRAGGVGGGEVPAVAVGIDEAEGEERAVAGRAADEVDADAGLFHFRDQAAAGVFVADLADGVGLELGAEQGLDVVRDDVELAVVLAVEEPAASAFFAAEGVVGVEAEDHAPADSADADQGLVAVLRRC